MRVNYQIVYVSDMKRSIAFYRDVFGIPLRFESPGWTEFATEGATLVLHAADAPAVAEDDPHTSRAGRCGAGFAVPNLAEFHKKMLANKVPCIQEPTQVFGAMVAQYVDPDGLRISVGEEKHATTRP